MDDHVESVTFRAARDRLPLAGREQLDAIRNGEPVRRVEGRHSRTGRFSSRKMGKVIQFESGTLEGPACWQYEHDAQVLEFFDQPFSLKVSWRGEARAFGVLITPDYFVVTMGEGGEIVFALEEWHPEADLATRATKYPGRYQPLGNGLWRDVAAEEAAARLGFGYRLRTARDVSPTLVGNVQLLEDYFNKRYDIPAGRRQLAVDFIGAHQQATLETLLRDAGLTVDEAFALIVAGDLWVDLSLVPLTQQNRVLVYATSDAAAFVAAGPTQRIKNGAIVLAPGETVTWAGESWQIVGAEFQDIHLVSRDGRVAKVRRSEVGRLVGEGDLTGGGTTPPSRAELLNGLSDKARKRLVARLQRIEPYLRTGAIPSDRATRSLLRRYRDAETSLGDGAFGLAPQFARAGRRGPRLDPKVQALARELLESRYQQATRPSLRRVFKLFQGICQERGLDPFSWRSFQEENETYAREKTVGKREGHRAAFAVEMKAAGSILPKDGDGPWQRVHVDHTQLDIELVDSESTRRLGKPWLTLATDAFSGRVFGHSLLFDSPSAVSILLVLRDIVDRFNRLPQFLITDHGSDFLSTYMETVAATLAFHLERRPVGHAKFGSPVERLNGLVAQLLIYTMRGNTQNARAIRVKTKEVDPKRLAVWTLPALSELLEHFLYEDYDARPDASTGLSPRERFEHGIATTGARPQIYIANDRHFRILTSPSTPKGTARVGQQGVKIQGRLFWNEAFRRFLGRDVEVRFDPLDASLAFAKIDGQWLDCLSGHHARFAGRSTKEIATFTSELRQRLKVRDISEATLARELDARVTATEADLIANRRRTEQRDVLRARGLVLIEPSADSEDRDVGADSESGDEGGGDVFDGVQWDDVDGIRA